MVQVVLLLLIRLLPTLTQVQGQLLSEMLARMVSLVNLNVLVRL